MDALDCDNHTNPPTPQKKQMMGLDKKSSDLHLKLFVSSIYCITYLTMFNVSAYNKQSKGIEEWKDYWNTKCSLF